MVTTEQPIGRPDERSTRGSGGDIPPAPPASNDSPSALPGDTTIRFALLIATVVASGVFVFQRLYFLVPAKANYLFSLQKMCFADPRANPGPVPIPSPAAELARQTVARCMTPAFFDQALWIGYGFLLLFGLAGVIYWLHPWWRKRHRKLELMADDESTAQLLPYLDELRQQMGLAQAPTWFFAPYARRGNAVTFGRPGYRCIQLNLSLVMRYHTNRAPFRAVVLHELAHLRNHDVDKTYLTIAIWWSFIVVVVVPFAVLAAYNAVWPHRWSDFNPYLVDIPSVAGLALALTALVYLVRNAILRVRETHADAVAVACDRSDSALRELIDRMPPAPQPPRWWPRRGTKRPLGWGWWSRLGTHPLRDQRLAILQDPAALVRPTPWELAGAGIAAGILGSSLDHLARDLLRLVLGKTNSLPGNMAVGLLLGALLAGVLAGALWRTALADPGRRTIAGSWIALPIALASGIMTGVYLGPLTSLVLHGAYDPPAVDLSQGLTPTSEMVVQGGLVIFKLDTGIGGWEALAVLAEAGSSLVAGAVLVAFWFRSAVEGFLTSARRSRRTIAGVVAVAMIATAPWFAVWHSIRDMHLLLPTWGESPEVIGSPAWYQELSRWVGLMFQPLIAMEYSGTLLGLTLLWLVPVVVMARRHRHGEADTRLGTALMAGIIGGLAAAVASVVLPFVAKSSLPETVRYDLSPAGFPTVYWNTFVVIAAVAQAAVAATVATLTRRYRPSLVLLATSLTAVLATVGQLAGYTAFRALDLAGTAPSRWLPPVIPTALAADLHTITIRGLILVIPAAGLSALLGTVLRRRREGDPSSTVSEPSPDRQTARDERSSRLRRYLPLVPITLLVVVTAAAVVLAFPLHWQAWTRWGAG